MSPLEGSPLQHMLGRGGIDKSSSISLVKHHRTPKSAFPSKQFKALQSLSILQADVSDTDLRYVVKNKNLLVRMILADCQMLKYWFQKLNLIHALKITSLGFRRLSALSQLTKVNLTGCPELSDQDVTYLVPNWKNLERLSLAQCKLLTDTALFAIAAFCKHLKVLNLHHLKVSDKGAAILFALVSKLSEFLW